MDHLDEMLSSLSICNSSTSASPSSSSPSSYFYSTLTTSSILNVSNYEVKYDSDDTSRYKIDPVNLVGKIGAVIISFLIVIGLVGNLLVLTVIIKTRHLRRSYNVLIASLSVTDLIFNAFIMPFYVDSYLYRRWRFTDDLCRFETYFGTMTVMTSAFHIGLIATNRFFLIVLPRWYPMVSSGRALFFQIGLVWMLALAVVLPGAFGWNAVVRYSDQIGRCSYLRSESRMSLFLVFNFGFICPCVVMCFCYFMIWNVTRQSRRKLANHAQRPIDRAPPAAAPSDHVQSSVGVVKSNMNEHQVTTVDDAMRKKFTETSQSSIQMQRLRCHDDETTRNEQIPLRSEETEEDAQEAEDETMWSSLSLQGRLSVDDADRLLLVKTLPAPPPSPTLTEPLAAAAEEHQSLTTKQCPHPEKTHSTTGIDSLRLSTPAAASNADTMSITLSSTAAEEPDSPLKHSYATDHLSESEAHPYRITDTPQLLSKKPFEWKSVDAERLSKTNLVFLEDVQLLPVVEPLFIKSSETETYLVTPDKSEPLLHICVPDSPSQREEDEEEEGEECKREEEEEKGENEEEEESDGCYDISCTGNETVIEAGHDAADQTNIHFTAPAGIRSDVSTTRRTGFVASNRRIRDNCFERSETRVLTGDTRDAGHQTVRLLLRLLRCRPYNRTAAMTKQEQFQVHSGNLSRAPDSGHFRCGCWCSASSGTTAGPSRNGQFTGSFENPSAAPPYSLALNAGDGVTFASRAIRSSHVQDICLLPEQRVNVAAYNGECIIRPGICQPATKIPKLVKRNDDHAKKACRQVTRSNQRSVRMILVIFVAFLLTYLPFTVMNLADEQSVLDRNWYMITSLGFWSGSCVNPLIYGIMNRQFRAAYGSIFLTCRKAILSK